MDDLKISVLLSTYNSTQSLSLSLSSLVRQSRMPDQIIIADDGSGPETRAVIDAFREHCPVPVVHLWHEDDGFRKAIIVNQAAAAATGNYLLLTDGDIILHEHLIRDHCSLARKGLFLSGSRVSLPKGITGRIMRSGNIRIPLWTRLTTFNAWRIPALMPWITQRYKQGPKHRYRTLKGCNMSCWRDDLIAVNGYDESFTGWGYEDTDLGVRLRNYGLKMLNIKFGAVVYHLYHRINSRENADLNLCKTRESIRLHKKWCEEGMNKYL